MASPMSAYQIFGNADDDQGCCQQKCLTFGQDVSSSFGNTTRRNYDIAQKEMKSTEDFLASELSKLSVQERSKALDDLHCVGEELQETPELVEQSLKEFDRILKERKDPIYQIAASQNQAYVEDPNFRLRFLRAKAHDAKTAVKQMIGFLKRKEIYFGRDTLARDITLDDLNDEDMEFLSAGFLHIQEGTDRSGRVVVFMLNHAFSETTKPEMMIRVEFFIIFQLLSPLESVQKKGIVICYYDMSTPEKPCYMPELNTAIKWLDSSTKIPIRRTALHVCLKASSGGVLNNKNRVDALFRTVLRTVQQYSRIRARVHYGTDLELQYQLRSHGFHPETIPVDVCGNLRRDILNVWFYKYVGWHSSSIGAEVYDHNGIGNNDQSETILDPERLFSRNNNNPNRAEMIIVEPTEKDVLLGRGYWIQKHPGNVRFREFLKEHQEEYNNTARYKRVDKPKELTRMLMEDGIRFLQKSESGVGWVESTFAEAEKKVKQLFRSQKKLKKPA